MSFDKIKQISIREYLDRIGVKPARESEYKGMYHSPLREDKNASFSVDYIRNVWFDHGLGEGGSIIDLVARIENCSIGEAISKLENQTGDKQSNPFSFHRNTIPDIKVNENNTTKSNIAIQNIVPLSHPLLLQYLKERQIDINIAKKQCEEIHYAVDSKEYYAIGFQNDSGGYVLRNKYFKGCTSSDITTHTSIDMGNKEACLVFESFTDYLSYLTLKNQDRPKQDAVILNSVHNLSKAIDFIKSHKQVYTYLDNDDAGRKTTEAIKANCWENTVSDQSTHYAKYKDLNDYLSAVKQVQKPVRKQSNLRMKR
ncbi:toprim domain-containing protein [Dysgonomonas sp. BGC7]|uniref:toprim domain-containing protein n=1 Tax=Dysgonomonas sp. BGC7 TaxID=1658008 RepID=UPI000682F72E|nr:toprim domain-containing protein [Dysgonomonas sp. BGC7]MBD8387931.1 toprim domain-containing protein [Dysgonomonas sp. BGC7]